MPGTVNVRRRAQTSSITSSEEGKADIFEDMVDQLPPVPDTQILGSQKVLFSVQIWQASPQIVAAIFLQK